MRKIKSRGALEEGWTRDNFKHDPDDRPARVVYWYDREARVWTVQVLDDAGHQVGASEQCGDRAWAEESAAELARAFGLPKPKRG